MPGRHPAGGWRARVLALALGSGLLLSAAAPAAGAPTAAAPPAAGAAVHRVPEAEYIARLKAELPEFFDTERYATTPLLFRARVAGAGWVDRPLVPLWDVPEEVTLLFNAVLFQLSDKAYYQPHSVRRLLQGVVGFEAEVRGRLVNLTPITMYVEQHFSAGKLLAGLLRENPEGVKENLAMAWYKALYGSGEEARSFVGRARRAGLGGREEFLLAARVYETIGDHAAAQAVLAEQAGPR
jgi:hypothetical protein